MRIDRFDLLAYGPFTNKSLDLADGEYGLHVIYGDNEAGKSTSLRALGAWMFGIPARTRDNFLHAHPQLRLGGKLRLLDGTTIEFSRKKGNKNTLLRYGTSEPLDDNALAMFIPAGIDETIFAKLWGINHDGLIAGGRELLEQSGDLGQVLFSAAAGTANLREVLSDIRDSAGAIFKPRATTAVLNRAVANYKEAKKRIKEASLPVSEWKKLHKDLYEKNALIEEIEKEIETKDKIRNRLLRVNRVKGAIAQRRDTLKKINELDQAILLPEDFEEQRQSAVSTLQHAGEGKQRLEAKLKSLTEEVESLKIRHDLLENREAIEARYKELGAVEKMLKDRPQQDGKRRLLLNGAENLLKSIRPDLGLDMIDTLRPLLNNKKRISALAKDYSLLLQKKENIETSRAEIRDQRSSLQDELESNPHRNLDLKDIKTRIADVRRTGDIEQRLAEEKKRAADGLQACRDELARLGRFSGTIDAVLEMALPVPETLDLFEKEHNRLAENHQSAAQKKRELEEEKGQAERDLQELLLQRDVPTVSDLKTARSERDTGWCLIKRRYIELADIEPEVAEFSPDDDLSATYEKMVGQADLISDRLRRDADRVSKRTELENKIDNLQIRIAALQATLDNLKTGHDDFQTRWSSLWEPLQIEPATPREMKQWLLKVEKLVEKIETAKNLSANEQRLLEKCAQLKRIAAQQLVKFDTALETEDMSLAAMISLVEERIEQEEAVLKKRKEIENLLNEYETRYGRARDELESVQTKLTQWKQDWTLVTNGLGVEANAHPEIVTETFDKLSSLFEKYDDSEELRKRIYGMDQVKEQFDRTVFEFADAIGINAEGDASVIAAQLNRDLNTAREHRAGLVKIEDRIKEIKQEIEDAAITIASSRKQLSALRAQALVPTDEELAAASEKSQKKRGLQKDLEVLEQELNRNGDGLSIEALERECEEIDLDAINSELALISSDLDEIHRARDELRDARQTIQNDIDAKDGSAAAARAAEDAQECMAEIHARVEQYLRLQAASLILEQQIERYRKSNQAPVLARSGDLFHRLTLGSYAGLRDELDNTGKPILLGIRPDDREVTIDAMSDGTRDQLFLSLRLATLEQHLSGGEPMPFIVDDILIGFDDNRTRVCLDVLAELAESTQVLLFTHHHRVIELAEPMHKKAGIFLHELA